MDYFKNVDIYNVTGIGVLKVFHDAYMTQVRGPILKKFGKYETNHMLNIALCMIHGSLKDVLTMDRGSKVFRFFLTRGCMVLRSTSLTRGYQRVFKKSFDDENEMVKI